MNSVTPGSSDVLLGIFFLGWRSSGGHHYYVVVDDDSGGDFLIGSEVTQIGLINYAVKGGLDLLDPSALTSLVLGLQMHTIMTHIYCMFCL